MHTSNSDGKQLLQIRLERPKHGLGRHQTQTLWSIELVLADGEVVVLVCVQLDPSFLQVLALEGSEAVGDLGVSGELVVGEDDTVCACAVLFGDAEGVQSLVVRVCEILPELEAIWHAELEEEGQNMAYTLRISAASRYGG